MEFFGPVLNGKEVLIENHLIKICKAMSYEGNNLFLFQ